MGDRFADDSALIKGPVKSCVVHSQKHRTKFHQIVNILRDDAIVPRIYMNKIAGLVCSCHSYQFHEELDNIILNKEHTSEMRDCLFKKLEENQNDKLKEQLLRMKSCKLPVDFDASRVELSYNRLLYLLKQVFMMNSCELLVYKRNPEQPKGESSNVPTYLFEKVLCFDIPFRDLGYVFGTGGRHIKTFQKEHNCSLRLIDKSRFTSISKFELKVASASELTKSEEDFTKYVKAVLLKRQVCNEKSTRFYEELRKRLLAKQRARKIRHAAIGFSGNTSPYMAAAELKETDKNNYSVKYHHMMKTKDNRRLSKDQPRKNVLENSNSRCANCIQPYNSDENKDGACRYHPGYIDTCALRWTCCRTPELDRSLESQRQGHLITGCATGRHIWKPHKKTSVSKKYGQSMVARDTWNLTHMARQ